MEFKVGDKVKIINTGYQYSTYTIWVEENAPLYLKRFGRESNGKRGQSGKIVAKGIHGRQDGFKMLYLVDVGGCGTLENRYCLISGDGIEIIKGDDEVGEFKVGDKAKIVGSELTIDDLATGCIVETEDKRFMIFKDTKLFGHDSKLEDCIINLDNGSNGLIKKHLNLDSKTIDDDDIVKIGYPRYFGEIFWDEEVEIREVLWEKEDEVEIEPKTFQEVLEEVNNTPDTILIKMEHRFQNLNYRDLGDMLHEIADIWFNDDISKVLLEGKFYTKKI